MLAEGDIERAKVSANNARVFLFRSIGLGMLWVIPIIVITALFIVVRTD